ncbi:MAG: FIST N-terminal domain-containing protein [Parcubacteria group bacterium]
MSMIKVGMGISEKEDLLEAVKEAAKQAREKIKTDKPKLLLVYHTFNYAPNQGDEAQAAARSFFSKETPVIGGQFLGIFVENICRDAYGSGGKQRGVGVLALDSEYFNIGLGLGLEADKNPEKAGADSVKMALDNLSYNPSVAYTAMMSRGVKDVASIRPLNGIIITPGLINDIGGGHRTFLDNRIADGISSVAKRSIRVLGGGVCGGLQPVSPVETMGDMYLNGKTYKKSVITCLFGSDLDIGYGVGTGFSGTGIGFFITKSNGFTVEELNGQPAFSVLAEEMKKYGVELQVGVPLYYSMALQGYTLALPEIGADFYWPIPPLISSDGKSVIFEFPLNSGTPLSLVKISKDSCLKAIEDSTKILLEDAGTSDLGFVYHVSCGLRGITLGPDYNKEAERIKNIVGEKVPVFGIASTGEMSFYKTGRIMGAAYTFGICGISNKLFSER